MWAVPLYLIPQNKIDTEVAKGDKFYVMAYLLKARTA
jgi:hypothetical protein